jgi:hypothetical protein
VKCLEEVIALGNNEEKYFNIGLKEHPKYNQMEMTPNEN